MLTMLTVPTMTFFLLALYERDQTLALVTGAIARHFEAKLIENRLELSKARRQQPRRFRPLAIIDHAAALLTQYLGKLSCRALFLPRRHEISHGAGDGVRIDHGP